MRQHGGLGQATRDGAGGGEGVRGQASIDLMPYYFVIHEPSSPMLPPQALRADRHYQRQLLLSALLALRHAAVAAAAAWKHSLVLDSRRCFLQLGACLQAWHRAAQRLARLGRCQRLLVRGRAARLRRTVLKAWRERCLLGAEDRRMKVKVRSGGQGRRRPSYTAFCVTGSGACWYAPFSPFVLLLVPELLSIATCLLIAPLNLFLFPLCSPGTSMPSSLSARRCVSGGGQRLPKPPPALARPGRRHMHGACGWQCAWQPGSSGHDS